MRATLLVLALATAAIAQPAPGDKITAVISSTAFPASAVGAPLDFAVGDAFTLARLTSEGGRQLVYFSESGSAPLHRTDAAAFGIEPPDPWAVERGASHETRYTHGRANVRSGPGMANRQLTSLTRGDRVYVLGCHEGWCRVELPYATGTDTRAFISESLLHSSPPPAPTYSAPSGSSYRSVAVQCSAIARSTGSRCRRRTTNASGRCWQH